MSLISTLGGTSTLSLYCYAMLVDVVWFERSMKNVRVLLMVKLKVATLIHIWGGMVGHPGAPSGLPGHLENPVLAQGDP